LVTDFTDFRSTLADSCAIAATDHTTSIGRTGSGSERRESRVFTRIVVGTDGSETAAEAVHQAIDLAKLSGASLAIVSAYAPVSGRRVQSEQAQAPPDVQHEFGPREDVNLILEAAAAEARKAGIEEVEIHPVEDDPADAILNVAEKTEADLIVVGNKGMTGARRFLLGSVPNNISHHAPCSVVIIRTT
jgi:nucleotide-binding universal stress UspA family protein